LRSGDVPLGDNRKAPNKEKATLQRTGIDRVINPSCADQYGMPWMAFGDVILFDRPFGASRLVFHYRGADLRRLVECLTLSPGWRHLPLRRSMKQPHIDPLNREWHSLRYVPRSVGCKNQRYQCSTVPSLYADYTCFIPTQTDLQFLSPSRALP
jgi:hypothetical protein